MVTSHRLAGHFSVEASATRIRHYRYVEERMMRILGGWIALTPELSAKLLLGRHVWDCAQHADLWGKRLSELRAPAQQSEPPGPDFVRLMATIESAEAFHQTPERLVGVYRVLKPSLLAAYERHLAIANPVYEPPTRRILRRCIEEERRHVAAGQAVLRHLTATPERAARAGEWEERTRAELGRTAGVAGDGVVAVAALPGPEEVPEIAQDLVQLEKPVGRWPIPEALAAAVEAQRRAVVSGDLAVIAGQFAAAGGDALEPYRELAAASDAGVVACARVGEQWQVKLRATGPWGVRVLQARWVPAGAGWRVAEVEVVRREPPGP